MSPISLVVLPFHSLSQNQAHEYYSDGITDSIIQALSSIKELKVISRTSSFYLKGKNLHLAEIASQLNVSHVLEGSVRLVEDILKVSVNLVEAKTEFSLWSQTWKRNRTQLFELEDEICLKIADKLREDGGHLEVSEHLVNAPTPTLSAYEHYLKGKTLFNKWNPEDVSKAIAELEIAQKLDPQLLDAHISLADAYSFMAVTAFAPVEESLKKSEDALQKAKKIDPESAALNYLLANDMFFTKADYNLAMHYSLKAIKNKPTSIENQRFLVFLNLLANKIDEAKTHLFYAKSIDPLGAETNFYEGYFYYRTEAYEKASERMKWLLDENPKNIPAITVYVYTLLMQQKIKELEIYLNALPEMMLLPDERLGIKALLQLEKGDPEFEKSFAQIKENAMLQKSMQADAYLYILYARQGKIKEAFETAERVFSHSSSLILLHFGDPLVKNLRKYKAYHDLHQRIYKCKKTEDKKSQPKTSILNEESAKNALSKLDSHLKKEQAYLNPQLSLRLLAEEISIHPNQLSWLLNEKVGQNFNGFINKHRILHFKQLASKAENAHISIIGLAYESGFNSKSVFNTAFKKQEGITPKSFLASVKQKGPKS